MTSKQVFKGIHQVGIAVNDAEAVARLLAAAFGSEVSEITRDDTPGVGGIFATVDIGEQHLEIMQDIDGNGPIAKTIGRRGEGLYCVFVEVTDIREAMKQMKTAGIVFTDEGPMVTHNATYYGETYAEVLLAWTHPKYVHGIVIELQQFVR